MPASGNPATRVAQGALMGAANIVPGVSGGTLALMFGIYERLITAISDGAGSVVRFAEARTDGHGYRCSGPTNISMPRLSMIKAA